MQKRRWIYKHEEENQSWAPLRANIRDTRKTKSTIRCHDDAQLKLKPRLLVSVRACFSSNGAAEGEPGHTIWEVNRGQDVFFFFRGVGGLFGGLIWSDKHSCSKSLFSSRCKSIKLMRRAALSGWYQLPVRGLAGCRLAGKSGSTGTAHNVLKHSFKKKKQD